MVSPSKPNRSRVASHQQHKCKLIKGPKPLIHFKFYLDIEKHHTESKIEKTIRELGGSIEFFLAKEVTHFITDKSIKRDGKSLSELSNVATSSHQSPILAPKTPITPQTPQQASATAASSFIDFVDSASPNGTPNDARATCSRPKSRADAMLQRARTVQQPSSFEQPSVRCSSSNLSQSPVQLAQAWGTSIWSTEYTLKFLEKVSLAVKFNFRYSRTGNPAEVRPIVSPKTTVPVKAKETPTGATANGTASISSSAATGKGNSTGAHSGAKGRSAHARHLRGDYVKIESTQKHYRPYYQEIKIWPTIHLNGTDGFCPFQVPTDKTIRTNNRNPNRTVNNTISNPRRCMPTTISKVGNRNSSGLPHQSPTVAPDNVSVESSVRNLNQTEYTNVMTRKTRNKQVRDGAAVGNASVVDACSMKTHNDIIKRDSDKCGYCEACRIEYDVLSVHLQTKEHLAFKNNGENYIQVDKLINDGANVESFLKATTGRTHKPALANQSPTNLNAKSLTNGNHAVKESENGRAVSKMSADDDADVINDDCDCGNVNGNGELVQMNGIAKMSNGIGDDDVSPNVSPRGKLPKYSPPMTRRSQNKSGNSKSSSPAKTLKPEQADAECEANEVTSPRARRENAKRINCINSKDFDDKTTETQTPKTMEHVASDDSPQMRRLIRTFPRYKVSTVASKDTDDGTAAAMHPPTVSSTVSADCEHGQSTSKRMTQHEHRDPASGIIVKFKRVRESELSKLTFEADNFMFPKQRDELPTDDDRPSTSEQCPDVSSDILSSDVDEPSAASPPKQTADEPSDLFTSSGRRKKRRTQYDSFKAEQRTTGVTASESVRKRKFRESLVRPRLSITKAVEESPTAEAAATTVATDAQQSSKGTRRNVKRGKGGRAKKAAPTPRAKRAAKGGAAAATDGPNEAEDGTRDNSYNGGSILSTDFFKTFEFSFERVPANEPWFLAFQRQDECRERIFEYWGNTAYRKLPFELGPLPPLQSDCCILSKLAAMKAARQQKSRRGRNAKAKAARIASETDEQNEAGNSQAPDEAAPLMTTITRSSNKEAGDGAHSRKPSLPGGDSVARKSRTSSLAKLLMNESALNNLASSIPPKKRVLLDAFGQPRKSPREHASTLAILSSLVQQKRKRLKELNGGISPEKMPNYSAALGTSNDATDTEELEDDDFCDNDSKNVYDVDDQHSRSSMRKSSTNTPQPTKDAEITTDSCEKLFFLRKGKRRQTASTSSNNDTVDAKAEEAAEPEAEQAVKAPKMPVDDYVDPNKVAKKIDDLLNSCYSETGNEFGDIELPAEGSVDAADLILVNTPKDFVEILMSVKEGPLTYRSFVNVNKKTGLSSFTQRGKKRHINKTGWPSLPKRRVTIKKEKVDEICIDDAHAHSNTEDEENHSNAEEQCSGRNRFHVNRNGRTDGDCIDISSQLMGDEFFIQSRQKLKTPSSIKGEHFDEPDEGHEADDDDEDGADDDDDDYNNDDLDECETFCNDNDNAVSNLFASSSEKAENSDIFTVSSDSLDTTDLPDTKSGAKLVEPGTPSVQDEDESLNETDDESSSDATTIADIKKSLSPLAAKPMQKMETRATNERSPITKDKINKLSLQPIVCVRKISEKDLYRRTYSKSTSPQKSAKQSPIKHPSIDSQSLNQDLSTYRRNSSSPKAKISPRKLRKPRGRWYRER